MNPLPEQFRRRADLAVVVGDTEAEHWYRLAADEIERLSRAAGDFELAKCGEVIRLRAEVQSWKTRLERTDARLGEVAAELVAAHVELRKLANDSLGVVDDDPGDDWPNPDWED